MIDNKTLRQSSKIYDYTKYIINSSNINYNKKLLLEKIKLSFFEYFPIFQKIIKNRQQKIIISFTSYPKRFNLIPTVLKSLYEQTFPINTLNMVLELTLFWSNHRSNGNIVLILTNEDKKYFDLNKSNIEIITINKYKKD